MNTELEHLLSELERYLDLRGTECGAHLARRCKYARQRLVGKKPSSQEFQNLALTDARVHHAIRLGLCAEHVAVMLAKDIETLKAELMKLHNIAPRKIRFPDGTVRVWTCPHEHIPETNLG